jgi:hypothetical protein
MVLLRRLEALVLQAPELVAEVARLEAQWHQQRQTAGAAGGREELLLFFC